VTGSHRVRVFELSLAVPEIKLPEGWKPFTVLAPPERHPTILVVARKWERAED